MTVRMGRRETGHLGGVAAEGRRRHLREVVARRVSSEAIVKYGRRRKRHKAERAAVSRPRVRRNVCVFLYCNCGGFLIDDAVDHFFSRASHRAEKTFSLV